MKEAHMPREDYITMPMKDWTEYQARRRDLAASYEKRRKKLRRCRATLKAWDKAYKMTMEFASQDVDHGKAFTLILEGMREIVLREIVEWDATNAEDEE
jgi:hypothetical protein